jgi:hypothetical protein
LFGAIEIKISDNDVFIKVSGCGNLHDCVANAASTDEQDPHGFSNYSVYSVGQIGSLFRAYPQGLMFYWR